MEQSLHFELGRVVWREEQERIALEFSCRDDKRGLYKAWIAGGGPPFSLGTLLPEDGMLCLRRKLSKEALAARLCWPIVRAGVTAAHRFNPGERPQWQPLAAPERRFAGNPALLSLLDEAEDCLIREEAGSGRWRLAIPWGPQKPFPLTPLFCLCQVQTIQGETYAVYTFDESGLPKVPAS